MNLKKRGKKFFFNKFKKNGMDEKYYPTPPTLPSTKKRKKISIFFGPP